MENKDRMPKEAGACDWGHKLILVVDDDEFIRYSMNRNLTAQGYRIKTMKDGFDVLQACLTLQPDLIISDIRMPRLDGVTLLQGLRNRPETRDIPVIFMSAFATDELMDEARKLGAEYFLIKPFPNDKLSTVINNVLSRRDSRKLTAGTEWKG